MYIHKAASDFENYGNNNVVWKEKNLIFENYMRKRLMLLTHEGVR